MSTNLPFPLADFYDALVAKNVKDKLEPFIAQFRKKNIYIIYQCVNRLLQIITNKSELPILKFNALMATRYFYDTCEYPAITFIQVFMLPVIYEVALEKYLKRSQEGIQLYFVDRGAQNTKEIRRLGLNYVQFAAQFIFNSAKVKPYRLIENRELKEQSNFVRTVKVLGNKGIQQPEKCIYYIPSYHTQTRKKFLKKLKHFSPQPYISFIISQFLEEINLNKKCDLDIKKLLLFGDSFLTSTMVQIIQEELTNMSRNFISKRKYLNLLNDLIRSGEIESIYLINTTGFINDIADQIGKVKGQLGHTQGEYIYLKIQASKQEKKEFYIEFLRLIQIWASCMPVTDEGQQSDVSKIFNSLKKRNFIFSKNVILKKIKAEMEENLLLNQQRNDTLMKIIDQDDRASSRNAGSYVTSKGQFRFHFPEYKEKNSFLELDELQDKVFQVNRKIARLTVKKQELADDMKYFQNFKNSWEQDLQMLDIQDEDPHQLQILVDEGDLCCQQYKLVYPHYELYQKGKINYDTFIERIQFLQNPDQKSVGKSVQKQSKNNSQVMNASIQQRLKASKMQSVSNSVRKNIQDEYFAHYGHHYNRQDNQQSMRNEISQQKQTLQIMQKKRIKQGQSRPKDSTSNQQKLQKKNTTQQNNKAQFDSLQNKSESKKHSQLQSSLLESKRSKAEYKSSVKQKQKANVFTNPLRKQKQSFQKDQVSQISSSQQSDSNSENQKVNTKKQSKNNVDSKPQLRKFNFQSSGSDFNIQDKKNPKKQPSRQIREQVSPTKSKSIIKHSVISKSSYHSQPTEPKILDTNYQEGGSVMNDYQMDANYNQGGKTNKKSSIKRTENTGMKNSSHKRPYDHNKQAPLVGDAVSPFKKKKSQTSKDVKIKESYLKQYQFVNRNKKMSNSQINQNLGYDDVFRRDQNQGKSKDNSSISSESQSVIEKRKKRRREKDRMREPYHIEVNDQSEYYNQDTSILRKEKNKLNIKTQSNSPSKNIILFQSKHESSKKFNLQRAHQDYEIKQSKIHKLTDKISQFSKNASKFANSRIKNSGIKLISKNQHRNFDSLYKNEYNNQYGQSGFAPKYQEVTSQYNKALGRSKSPKQTNEFNFNNQTSSRQQKSSFIDNPDYSPVSLEQINGQIQKYKTKPTYRNDPQTSQICEPQNMPMLYSQCSDKSIHSKMTDSHTRKGNRSSNFNDFKSCYLNMDKQVLPLDLTKIKAVSSSFSLDKAQNFLDFRGSNAKSSSKMNTVVDAISEKNAKNSILLYKLQRQKNRLVESLQNKIKSLQVNGKMMKTKLAVKDQSVRQNIESRQFSERQLRLNSREVKNSRQSSNQNNSLSNYDGEKKNMNGLRNRDQAIVQSDYQNRRQMNGENSCLINTKIYQGFFKDFLRYSSKKILHKKKGLLMKNDEIQIGYMISKKDKTVLVSVFITPGISSIKNVVIELECDHNLSYKAKPQKIDLIEVKRQQIVMCSFSAQNIPFKLPLIHIKFDANRNYKQNAFCLGLPCTMLLFSETNGPSQSFQSFSNVETYRTDVFKCDKKISKIQKLRQILPSFKQVNKQSRTNSLQGTIKYQNVGFEICVTLNDLGSIAIQGYSRQKQNQNSKFLQYLMSTLKFIFQGQEATLN